MRAWMTAAGKLGHRLAKDEYAKVIGLNEEESVELLISMLDSREAYSVVREHVAHLLTPERDESVFPLKNGCAELLRDLNKLGVPCAVASSSSSSADEIQDRLSRAGILHYFKATAGGDEVTRGKPDPAVYQLAVSRLGVSASECVAFEDSEHGARAAMAAGAQVVLVPDMRQPSPKVVARSLQGILLPDIRPFACHALVSRS